MTEPTKTAAEPNFVDKAGVASVMYRMAIYAAVATIGHARLTPDLVLEVFHSTEPAKILAKRLDVSLGTINDIRGKRTWRRVTKDASRTSLRGRNQWVA